MTERNYHFNDSMFVICESFDEITDLINNHPLISVGRNQYKGMVFLNHIYKDDEESQSKYKDLIDSEIESWNRHLNELNSLCDKYFITQKGNLSSIFDCIKSYGYTTKVGESDSFGPLTGLIKRNKYEWWYCFG